jgi:putative N6-adenine-specific DNA methylase
MTSFFLTCAKGTEHVLARELTDLGLSSIRETPGGVHCSHSDPLFYYALNLQTRIAFRVFIPIAEFAAEDEEQLYEGIKALNWSTYMTEKQTLSILANCKNSQMTHSKYIALKSKDAICDYFKEKTGERPNVDTKYPDLSLNIFLNKNVCTVSLDSSGHSLHKRGYRQAAGTAPLMETLAATLIMLSKWDGKKPFYDLMCGSGTFAIEAALIANNTAPGLLRQEFNFKNWPDFNQEYYDTLVNKLQEKEIDNLIPIFVSDLEKSETKNAEQNAKRAGVADQLEFANGDILEFVPSKNEGLIMINPPYEKRLVGIHDIAHFYKKLYHKMTDDWQGMSVGIITPDEFHLRIIKLSPRKVYDVFNGDIACKFAIFDIFKK